MRDIMEAIASGSERAQLALDYMAVSILRYIGAYTMELGGIDAIAFTGGIGENSVVLRKMIIERMAFMGVHLDHAKNESCCGECKISSEDSSVEVHVIPADEEYMVVNETYKYCLKIK